MRSFVTYTLLASATLAVAIDPRFEFPDTVPALEKRQEPGTPQYQCHEDCGLLITLGREEGYCDNAEWNERYGRCMICANTYNIWQYYGNSVTSAAEKCGLSPTPSPSGYSASSTSAAASEPSTTAAAEETVVTSAAAEPSTSAAAAEETTTAAAPAASTTAAATSSSAGAGAASSSAQASSAAETSGSAVPTTLATSSVAAVPSSSSAAATPATSVGSVGTIGITPSSTPTSVVVSGAAKHFGFATAVGVAVFAMLSVY